MFMDQFMEQVRAYATRVGVKPSTVVQQAGCGGGTTWARWEAGDGSPTLRTADKILKFMAENPPLEAGTGLEAAE